MGRLLIINGSPRAPRSNSRRYAALFRRYWKEPVDEYLVTDCQHTLICAQLSRYDHLLLVFPLYADALPAALLRFLQEMERTLLPANLRVHTLVNCGFLEPEQNHTALAILQYFCAKNSMKYGSSLCIGSGEAILDTPFSFLVRHKIKKLASSIHTGHYDAFSVTMPLTKKMFIRASTRYWLSYGSKNHISEVQMRTMQVEGDNEA